MSNKAVIIGASTGIGRALAVEMSKAGYELGLTARSEDKLHTLSKELPGKSVIKVMDVTQIQKAQNELKELIDELGGMDIIILNAGTGNVNKNLDWESEKHVLDVNINGFCGLLNTAYHHFVAQKSGHIVSISSIASLLPNPGSSVYNASKAFVSNYVQGIRLKLKRKNIPVFVTDIKPGYVDTPLTEGNKGMFWISTAEKAARQTLTAIKKKKKLAYITKRWRFIAWIAKALPDRIFYMLF